MTNMAIVMLVVQVEEEVEAQEENRLFTIVAQEFRHLEIIGNILAGIVVNTIMLAVINV